MINKTPSEIQKEYTESIMLLRHTSERIAKTKKMFSYIMLGLFLLDVAIIVSFFLYG